MRMRGRLLLCVGLLVPATLARSAPAETGWTAIDSVVAVVNQDVVLRSDLDRHLARYGRGLEEIKDPAARARRRMELRQQILQALIDERLFAQEAARIGLGASNEEVERAVADVKAQNHLDDAGLARALESQGLTMAQYREEIRQQIMQAKVANLILRPRVQIGEEEMRAAYKEAQKRDPKRIGTFDEVKQPLLERLFEEAMMREQRRWLAERRDEAFIEVRTES